MRRGPKPQGLNGERRTRAISVRFSALELAILRRAAGAGAIADLVRDGALGLAFRILRKVEK